ncbi:MAG: right-handed parallel beta-helix repeat-containing protein [Firmicutes bacterium]|nr:right-handed parallel beta-helix repeat-containing protein [Bacillota bacterium]
MSRQMRKNAGLLLAVFLLILAPAAGMTACGTKAQLQEVHVATDGSDDTGKGTPDAPYATITCAAAASPGSVILVHQGEYAPVRLESSCSGSEDSPTLIRAAEGEKPVIRGPEGEVCIELTDASYISIEGIETEGGTHGIACESTRKAGVQPLCGLTIRNCRVHGVRGVHGICVYGRNDLAPVQDLTIEGCQVYDCQCGSSESLVVNGNIDGFLIEGNQIHDNNNIGIDMIGFEGTAMGPKGDGNPYEVDQARNGVCRGNLVYNISSQGNPAYLEDDAYDLCADGIYVDGGRDIEICENYVYNCDIGVEVATEHSPEDNELFRVSGVHVHDNVIAGCKGWTGLCFGGYDKDLGFTEGCEFDHNTLVDNPCQIAVQRSRNNKIHSNLLIGGETAVEFSEDCRKKDMVNDISGNAAAGIEDEESWEPEYGKMYPDREEAADSFRSLIEDMGSGFVPEKDQRR